MSLDPEKCRLISAEQVELFREVEAILQSVRAGLPRVAEHREFHGFPSTDTRRNEGVVPDLDRLRESMSRTHYQVGLLGVTGASKSTSLNSLIGQTVLPQGSEGMPCTSVIQRIRFVPPQAPPQLELVFLDKHEWWKRRKMLCEQLKLADFVSDEEDNELLVELESLIKDPETPKNVVAMASFFQRFLLGRKFYSHRLEPGQPMGPITLPNLASLGVALKSVASHQGAGKEVPVGDRTLQDNECALLREVFISIPLPSPPPDLELVDLPGFLAGSGQDDVITKSYLERLDGACFLLNTQNLGLGVFDEVREDLNRRFRTLLGRVWIVATKIDSLAEDQLHSPTSSIFHGIDKAVRKWNLNDADTIYRHLLITSNEIFRRTKGKETESARNIIASQLKMDLDADGNLPMPAPLSSNEELEGVRRAFMHVLQDGGIERLRSVIQSELAVTVRQAVAESTRETMLDIVERTMRIVAGCRDQRGLTKEDHDAAIAWSNLFRELERRRSLADELAPESLRSIRLKLLELLNDYCPADNLPDVFHLRSRHANLATNLYEVAEREWLGEDPNALVKGRGVIGDALRGLENKARELARPKQLEGRSRNLELVLKPIPCLCTYAEELIRRNPKHAGQFAEVACPELFKDSWPADILPSTYREMMARKVDNLLFEATHRLQNALRSALAEVQSRLENLGDDQSTASTDPATPEMYDACLESLQAVRQKLATTS